MMGAPVLYFPLRTAKVTGGEEEEEEEEVMLSLSKEEREEGEAGRMKSRMEERVEQPGG